MRKLLYCNCSKRLNPFAPLILRLVVGAIFIVHGYQKLTGLEAFEGFLGSLGVPLAGLVAFLVMVVEFFGGIALVLGLFTHWVAKFQVLDMLFAILLVHSANGFLISNGGFEFVLLIFAATISLMITGAGPWSLDAKIGMPEHHHNGSVGV